MLYEKEFTKEIIFPLGGIEAQLFNGEYYFQKTDLHDRRLLDRYADFDAFWSLQDAYGSFEILQEGTLLRLTVCEGWLSVDRLFLPFLRGAKRLLMNGEALSFRFEQGYLAFEGPVQGVLEITGCC